MTPSTARPDSGGPTQPPDRSAAPISAETIEWIIEAVEQRVVEELERRGLRHNPGVF